MAERMQKDVDSSDLLLGCYQKALGHELPNLLVAGQGLTRLLLTEITDPEQRLILERIAQSVYKADSLIRRLAGIGRLHREPLRLEPVSLVDLVEEAAAEIRTCRGTPAIRPEMAPLPTLRTDRERLRHILLAILRNAYRAVQEEESPWIRITWSEPRLELIIVDNGCGLPERPMEQFLQPFNSGTDSQGLGLFTARLFLEDLSGTLELRRIAKGTEAHLLLPSLDGIL